MTSIILMVGLIISMLFIQYISKKKSCFFLYLLVGILLVGFNVTVKSEMENQLATSVSQNNNDKKPQEKKRNNLVNRLLSYTIY
jgi:hypothetical protein